MHIKEILNKIPHRYPFILVDRVLHVKEFVELVAIKNVSINEPYFNGHFPGNPVMPGVLILESLAQASSIFAQCSGATVKENDIQVFAAIDNVRFKKIVEPGDQLMLKIEYVKHKRDVWKIKGTALVEDEVVCSADLTSATREFNE
ncbi:MAG: 3-hydroxyacyl-ACP dehydratase FabZ [Legionellales bacterium]|nr:3-hydroxyacyl-ACP dehydratase FabZ [Legionellales bacterium]